MRLTSLITFFAMFPPTHHLHHHQLSSGVVAASLNGDRDVIVCAMQTHDGGRGLLLDLDNCSLQTTSMCCIQSTFNNSDDTALHVPYFL